MITCFPVSAQTNKIECIPEADPGLRSCNAKLTKWYYDTQSFQCRPFEYTGCRGNNNRFDTEEICRCHCTGACGDAPKAGKTYTKPPSCVDIIWPYITSFHTWYPGNTSP